MKSAFLSSLVLLLGGTSAFSQPTSSAQVFDGSVELISHAFLWPKPVKGQKTVAMTQETYDKPRFDLVTLKHGCTSTLCITYGSRFGNNWDIFNIGGGAVSQTRMVQIGKYKWTDKFQVPDVEPWAALAPGERRTVSVNTSGADGVDGSNGASGRGGGAQDIRGPDLSAVGSMKNEGYANAGLNRQVGSTVTTITAIRSDRITTPPRSCEMKT